MIRSASDLSPDQKSVIEALLGRPVLENETLSIRAIEPPALTPDRKRELAQQLEEYFALVDARRRAASSEEGADIIDEAIRSVRPGYHPHP